MTTIEPLKANEYKCAMCSGIFEKGWTDEEAQAEYNHYFPAVQDDLVVVCDDCFNEIHPKDHPMQVKLAGLRTPPLS